MERRLFCFLLALQIVSWTSATSRSLAPNDGFGVHPPATGQSSQSSLVPSSSSEEISLQSYKSKESGRAAINEEANAEEESKLGVGSTPPSCDHKCYGCIPCEAIQVPAISSKRSHLGLQYANYEPESWKCKCGPSIYSP